MASKQLHRAEAPVLSAVRAGERPTPPNAASLLHVLSQVAFCWDAATDAMTFADNLPALLPGCTPLMLDSGEKFARLIAPGTTARGALLAAALAQPDSHGHYRIAYRLQSSTAAPVRWVEETGHCLTDADGHPKLVRGILCAADDRHGRALQPRRLARRDAMTGTSDRTQLIADLDHAIAEAIRYRGACTFMLLGINNLSRINDAFGFSAADQIICEVARRIRPLLRNGDMLGRFSNNKFGVIIKNCAGDDMAAVAERFLAAIRDNVVATAAGPVAVTISAGGVSIPRHARTVDDALDHAQEALDVAKRRSAGTFHAWTPSTERESLRRMNIRVTEEIVTALNERRVVTAFEPVVSAATREVAFHECLVRMTQPGGQLLMAPDIVPVAERVGLIRLVDHRVLELVIAELAATPGIHLSLNISPDTTTDPQWLATVTSLLAAHPDAAGRLIVEITETQAIDDLRDTCIFVSRLKELGSRIAIDDFGAGYTSFRNLRLLDVDIVKIDGAFVRNMMRSADDRAFVQTLLDLARRLGIETVAEWVQDEATAALLAEWGCDYLQGRLIGLATAERPWRAASAARRPQRP